MRQRPAGRQSGLPGPQSSQSSQRKCEQKCHGVRTGGRTASQNKGPHLGVEIASGSRRLLGSRLAEALAVQETRAGAPTRSGAAEAEGSERGLGTLTVLCTDSWEQPRNPNTALGWIRTWQWNSKLRRCPTTIPCKFS